MMKNKGKHDKCHIIKEVARLFLKRNFKQV